MFYKTFDNLLCFIKLAHLNVLIMLCQSYAGYIVECTKEMLQSLENEVELGRTEFEIGEYMTRLTADIISRTEFDSSYEKGKQIFHLLTVLQHLCSQASRHLCFPGSRLVLKRVKSIFGILIERALGYK